MKSSLLLSLTFAALATPMVALALPAVGDIVGINPADATAALDKAGCKVVAFEAEGGQIEASCTDAATSTVMGVKIDPKTGAVTEIKPEED